MGSSKSLQATSNAEATTAVAIKADTTPVVADTPTWGEDVYLGASDIVIAKLLPMQPSSVLVVDGKAAIGEFRDSLSGAKLGSITEPVEFIPFHVDKAWDILEEDGDQFKWRKSIPLVEDPTKPGYNDNLPWSDVENGINIKRVRRMNFFVMLPKQIESGEGVPYVLSFKSTSYREGKKLFTQMYMRNRKAGLAPAAYKFSLAGNRNKNDKGTFIVPTIELGTLTDAKHLEECFTWYKLVKKGDVKVDANEDSVSAAEIMPDIPGEMGSQGNF